MKNKLLFTVLILVCMTAALLIFKSVQRSIQNEPTPIPSKAPVIVLDAGHGKSSNLMTDKEKEDSGWIYNENTNGWGEWRHFKYGLSYPDCGGYGCSKRVTPSGDCWYPMVNGDRDTEPEINLRNCLAAKACLEQMGYTVRLTRTTNDENPSVTRRLTYCYPDNNTAMPPDAAMFVCIHSNAGGGSGSSYIELQGEYDQPTTLGSSEAYVNASNTIGKYINDEITSAAPLHNNPPISGEPQLITFCKAPVPCGYLEIGFYDNQADLEILNTCYDEIGKAIANGIDKYLKSSL